MERALLQHSLHPQRSRDSAARSVLDCLLSSAQWPSARSCRHSFSSAMRTYRPLRACGRGQAAFTVSMSKDAEAHRSRHREREASSRQLRSLGGVASRLRIRRNAAAIDTFLEGTCWIPPGGSRRRGGRRPPRDGSAATGVMEWGSLRQQQSFSVCQYVPCSWLGSGAMAGWWNARQPPLASSARERGMLCHLATAMRSKACPPRPRAAAGA